MEKPFLTGDVVFLRQPRVQRGALIIRLCAVRFIAVLSLSLLPCAAAEGM